MLLYMTLNIEKVGKPLALIEGGPLKGKIISISSEVDDDNITKNLGSEIELPKESRFQQTIDPETERTIIYITGPSGSGKSTYCRDYAKQYLKKYKDNPIYLFSAKNEDDKLDSLMPKLKRIKIDESLANDPAQAEEFKDSMVIFDDVDALSDKKQRESVYKTLNQILELGRSMKIYCVMTNHLATSGNDTRRILNECHSITYFPHSGSAVGVKRLLVEYVGLDKQTIRKLKNSKSRWATIFKNYPQIAMTERNLFKVGEDDESEKEDDADLEGASKMIMKKKK